MKLLFKLGLVIVCLSNGWTQSPEGNWEHINNEGERVIITFGNDQGYSISIPNRELGAIDRIREFHIQRP